ncbi:hypothetical protein AWJ20_3430 [Sugiyamaella lignohabitans]|uniref:Uncharacterized protein n=1 Tax=Sugiyamaella lignohabitans TaxID=796027 RepID=A0A167FWF2_9ASCO|nr:uncharacterized protein AWJ20_3430 [Sugiyamaella lignohabitans]ANB15786.1 hypothetical protein AWJ20_3430 [Sugiyamaella lignohabitans]
MVLTQAENIDPFDDTDDNVDTLREQTAGLSSFALEEGMSGPFLSDHHLSEHGTSHQSHTIRDEMARFERKSDINKLSRSDGDASSVKDRIQSSSDEPSSSQYLSGAIALEDTPLLPNQESYSIASSTPISLKPGDDNSNNNNSLHTEPSRTAETSASSYHTFEDTHHLRQKLSFKEKMEAWSKLNFKKETIIDELIKKPISYIPPVILGTLLNVLDGLSYGMILFPLATPIFSHLGPAGLSMFYVSCIVSQLIYSLGGSQFKAGVGSEMIEVVPFFHTMAYSIMDEVGPENPQAVIATTILAFAISSMITGIVFFLLGYFGLGSLVGFFPRHILVGCVGGVGYFLVVTGIEVSSSLGGSLEYNWTVLSHLFQTGVLIRWLTPVLLAILLMIMERTFHNPLILPTYFTAIFGFFHLFVWLVPSWSLELARENGWIFQAPSVNEPWWSFYKLYDFQQTSYGSLLHVIPAMLALTFFGLLHVPINVPALAVATKSDDINVDRELIAHGMSNFVSGLCGSIQNYLVYTNSLFFIRSGADSRVAGVMLALATVVVMVSGPVLIGYIPIMLVGALIFLLGFELLIEALYDTWGRLNRFEYFTIVTIVLTMGVWDFVYGILIGIVLACVSFVIQASQTSSVKGSFTGVVARSTVRRHFMQQKFLSEVGDQIYVLKLSGYIFFGTVVKVEQAVRDLLDERRFTQQPIRYLIIDIGAVTDIDFSASEAFARMKRLLDSKGVFMLLSGATEDVSVVRGLKAIKLLTVSDSDSERPAKLFPRLNMALEWCENEFLSGYYSHRERYNSEDTIASAGRGSPRPIYSAADKGTKHNVSHLQIPDHQKSIINNDIRYGISPRAISFRKAVENAAKEDLKVVTKWKQLQQPLPIMMQIFQGVSDKGEDFWAELLPYFKREQPAKGTVLYTSGNEATGFYLVESGILRADYDLEQGKLYESILAGTTCGELPFFSETRRTATVVAETNAVVWKLDRESWEKLKNSKPNGLELANELLEIALRLTVERFTSITAYVMISS